MLVDAFDFDLPERAIALRPATPRDAARLLVVDPQSADPLADRRVRDLPDLLVPGDALVVNDTRVVPARLLGTRRRAGSVAKVEVTLHRRDAPDRWRAFVRPGRRLAEGETVEFADRSGTVALSAVLADKGGAEMTLRFDRAGAALDAGVEAVGCMPLPPYIARRRGGDAADDADYQTLFAARPGAVAAPTAGLHFTPALVTALERRGVTLHRVTLHVGAGTFLPVKAARTEDHRMHGEFGTVSAETVEALLAVRARGKRVVAVGTTSLRVLESAAREGTLRPFSGETDIFITPGYRFRTVDALLTNFHLPRSTLFMLVSAFSGLDAMRAAYAHAIASGYRFYSYGDACLLSPTMTAAAARDHVA